MEFRRNDISKTYFNMPFLRNLRAFKLFSTDIECLTAFLGIKLSYPKLPALHKNSFKLSIPKNL